MMNRKQSVVLKNFEIKGLFPKLVDKWGEEYFLIINNDKRNDDYFCFKKSMRREGWHTLAGDSFMGWDYSSKIGIEYEEIEKNGKIYKKVVDFGVVGCQREGYCQHFLEND